MDNITTNKTTQVTTTINHDEILKEQKLLENAPQLHDQMNMVPVEAEQKMLTNDEFAAMMDQVEVANITQASELTEQQQTELANTARKERSAKRKEMIQQNVNKYKQSFEQRRSDTINSAFLTQVSAQQEVRVKKASDENALKTEQQRATVFEHIEGMDEFINQLENRQMNAGEKEAILKSVRSAKTLSLGVLGYSFKSMPTDDESAFNIHLNMLQSMMGFIANHLNDALTNFSKSDGITEEDIGEATLKLNASRSSFQNGRLRLSDEAHSAYAKKEAVDWNKLMERSGLKQTIDLEGKVQGKTGANMSAVVTIGEGEEMRFFKGDEKVVGKDAIWDISTQNIIKESAEGEKAAYQEFLETGKLRDVYEYLKKNTKTDPVAAKQQQIEAALTATNILETFGFKGKITVVQAAKVLKEVARHSLAENLTGFLKIDKDEGLTERNIATTRMAELLGIDKLIARSEKASILTGGVETDGFVMAKAQGKDYSHLAKKKEGVDDVYTGEFQRQLTSLQYFDNICGQLDRHLNNVFHHVEKVKLVHDDNTVVKHDKFTGITGIDNDMAFGKFYPIDGRIAHMHGVIDKVDKNGVSEDSINLPHMDREFYEHLKVLSPEVIRANMKGLLNEEYVEAMIGRIARIMSAVEKAIKQNPNFLVDSEKWGKATLNDLMRPKTYNYVNRFVRARYRPATT